ncbi:hypothetical protein C2845_PM11G19260 [Panicum miliaceum]|uniref:Uncharacterized protein n=1 Tax=Panicum miliaceum TaxID=4540 RepID=A0A3L6RMY0_PANMI|nr:hypothetical protein C2845_PM11G19260 [Panicum miliaceum]
MSGTEQAEEEPPEQETPPLELHQAGDPIDSFNILVRHGTTLTSPALPRHCTKPRRLQARRPYIYTYLRMEPVAEELTGDQDDQKTQEDFPDTRRPWKTTKNYQVHAHLQIKYLLGIAC